MSGLSVTGGPLTTYYYFRQPIIDKIQNGISDFIYILPVNRAVRQFNHQLIDHSPNQTLITPYIFTFDSLLLDIYRQLSDAKKIVNREFIIMLVSEILEENRNAWKFFRFPDKIPPAFFYRVTDMISELRRFGFFSSNIDDFSRRGSDEGEAKLTDITLLQSRIEERLGQDLIDEAGAHNTAAALLNRNMFDQFFPDVTCIFISGYGLFTPAMFEFIEKVSDWKNVHLKVEHLEENQDLFRHTQAAVQRLCHYHENKPTPIARFLFNRKNSINEKISLYRNILITAAEDRRHEVEYIAQQILLIHSEQSLPLDKIGISFPDMESYVPLIRQIFREYGIPYNLSTGFPLLQSPLIRAFIHISDIVTKRYETTLVLDVLRLPFLSVLSDEELLLIKEFLFDRRIKYLNENALSRLIHGLPDSEHILIPLTTLFDFLKSFYAFPLKANVHDYRSRYLSLLKHCGLLNWFDRENPHLNERQRENEFRAFNRFMKSFDRIIWYMEQKFGEDKISIQSFMQKLTLALQDASYNLTEWPGYGVQIMPRLELQSLECRIVFLGGLIDGVFPRTSAKDVFFTDDTRSLLGLTTSQTLLDQDRFLFYTMLDAETEHIHLLYPRFEGDRVLVQSTFLTELEETFGIKVNTPEKQTALNTMQMEIALGNALQKMEFEQAEDVCKFLLNMPSTSREAQFSRIVSITDRIYASNKRRSGKTFSDIEGNLIDHPAIISELQKKYRHHTWSVSQLEDYATCPMSFFLRRILKIEETGTWEETITALEKGNLIHQILFDFYTRLRETGQTGLPLQYYPILHEVAENALKALPFEGFFWNLEKRRFLGTADQNGIFKIFLEQDQAFQNDSCFSPAFFEISFGISGQKNHTDHESRKSPVILNAGPNKLTISGKIDRVDINNKGQLAIHDYKTGRYASEIDLDDILEGQSFQLPLYLLALNQIMPDADPVYAGYFQIVDHDHCKPLPVLASAEAVHFLNKRSKALLSSDPNTEAGNETMTFHKVLRHSLETAIDKVEKLKKGSFSHFTDPDDVFCRRYCEYRRMCQKNTAKMKRILEE